MNFPIYVEDVKLGEIEFTINDIPVSFFDQAEKRPNIWTDENIIKFGSTFPHSYIDKLSDENREQMVEAILEITTPKDDKKDDRKDDRKIDYWIGFLISKGHTHAYQYHMRFFRTCLEITSREDEKEMARLAIASRMDEKAIKDILNGN